MLTNIGKKRIMWYKISQNMPDPSELTKKMKDIIRNNKFFLNLFKEFGVPIDRMDENLSFEIKDLPGKFAQSDSTTIYLNKKLFEDGDFFKTNLHFAIHELVHWLTRQKEKDFYFADPEEVESFSYSMAFELLRGKHPDEIRKVFFPIIEAHFDEQQDANKLYEALLAKAIVRIKQSK
jgi:hypothetical protein